MLPSTARTEKSWEPQTLFVCLALLAAASFEIDGLARDSGRPPRGRRRNFSLAPGQGARSIDRQVVRVRGQRSMRNGQRVGVMGRSFKVPTDLNRPRRCASSRQPDGRGVEGQAVFTNQALPRGIVQELG